MKKNIINKLRNLVNFLSVLLNMKKEKDVDKFCNNDSCEIVFMTGDNDDQDLIKLNLQKRTGR